MPPRLLYIGPAIAPGLGGQALLYKLLLGYPSDKLMLVQTHLDRTSGSPLEAADTINLPAPPTWAGPRARTLFDLSFSLASRWWLSRLAPRIKSFKPDAIISVIHGWSSELALVTSSAFHIPFHAIFHDAAEAALPAPRFLKRWRAHRWERLCRAAASRLCVSPYMAEEITRMTGLKTDILYPGLAPVLGKFPQPVNGMTRKDSLSFGFIGQVHYGFVPLLRKLGDVLEKYGHRLVMHSPQASEYIAKHQLNATTDGGWLPVESVASVLADKIDVCFLPMSFRVEDKTNTCVSFPSKLVEYCAAGRPVLIFAPSYSSIVRWARTQPTFAVIVESESKDELEKAIRQLESLSLRHELGTTSQNLANDLFSHEATYGRLIQVLSRSLA